MKLKFIASSAHLRQEKDGFVKKHLVSVGPLFGEDKIKNSRTDETKNADNKGRCLTPNILERRRT